MILDLDHVLDAGFKFWPYDHQLHEFEHHGNDPARAILWQMRTGKSKLTIDTVCHWMIHHNLDALIVIAPNGVHRNWLEREIPLHHWDMPYTTMSWDTHVAGKLRERAKSEEIKAHDEYWAQVKDRLKDPTPQWWAFASETVIRQDVRNLIKRIVKWRKRVGLVVDESDDYGRAGSKKTMMIKALAKKCVFRRILTGTVIENSPLRAFSQYELIMPEQKPLGFLRYDAFENHYALYETKRTRQGHNYPSLVDYQHMDELRDYMAKWSSVVLRDDVNLPPILPRDRVFEMTDQQKAAYRQVKSEIVIELEDGALELSEMTARLIKLQQVSSSYIVDKWGDRHLIKGANPRLDATMDEIDKFGARCVVWCAFRPEMDAVEVACKKRGWKVLTYHGGTSDGDKAKVRKIMAPDSTEEQIIVVGHERSGGRGLNFSRARGIINHSHIMDAVLRSQSMERATEMGGKGIDVVNVRGPAIDTYILEDILSPKVTLAEQVARSGLRSIIERI